MSLKSKIFTGLFLLLVIPQSTILFAQTKINPDSIPFAPVVNYGTGDTPWSVFCADLDGDSDLDLAVGCNSGVSILKNNGDGTFQSAVNYGASGGSQSVFCADLDNDGDLDIAAASWDDIVILKNNGNGVFQAAGNYGAGGSAVSIFCADLDRDGDLDLAATNRQSDNVSILKNNGDGTFQSAVNYAVGDEPWSVFCADLDGDSDLDLAVANQLTNNVSILKNNGDGTFQPKVDYVAGGSPHSVFCADLDGDSSVDLAVGCSGGVSILKNNGDGTFQAPANYSVRYNSFAVFCADLDGDGYLDLAVAKFASSPNVSILKNNGNGTFQGAVNYGTGNCSWSIFCSDLDGDTDLDLVVPNLYSNNVSIFKNLRIQPIPGIIEGTVKDARTQQFLDVVRVDALQNGIVMGSYITSSDGKYNIANLSPGTYDVQAITCGYETQTQIGKNVFAGQTTTVDFQLEKKHFRTNRDGWQFGNAEIISDIPYNGDFIMWPQYWWTQFDYCQHPYPPEFCSLMSPSDFPDWPLFASVFGENQCYFDPPPDLVIYNPLAEAVWFLVTRKWIGSCFGFAISSLLYLNCYLPLPDTFSIVYNIPINDDSRKLINAYHVYQFGLEHQTHIKSNRGKTAVQTLNELQQMLVVERKNDKILWLESQNRSGAHAVVACSLAQDLGNPSTYHIYIYDNRHPDAEQIIDINTLTNSWYYSDLPTWGGGKGLFLMDPISTYLSNPTLGIPIPLSQKKTPVISLPNISDVAEIYSSCLSNIVIRNSGGEAIGYSNSDSVLIDSMTNASPIIPATGCEHPPIGYLLPKGTYTAQISNSLDTVVYFSVFTDSSVFSYRRQDYQSGQTDNLICFDNGRQFRVKNEDANPKRIALKSISVLTDQQMVCELTNLTLTQSDSLQLEIVNQVQFKIKNTGSAKSYDLALELAKDSTNPIFEHQNILIPEFSAHQISPDWEKLDSLPVTIFVDKDLDDIFEETLLVVNEYTDVEDETGNREIPSEFSLGQNYPNPFNQTTKIEFALLHSGFVSLDIYDILGRKVRTLISENLPSGYKSVVWDGKDNSGKDIASGTYFYQLKVNEFSQARKLVLLK